MITKKENRVRHENSLKCIAYEYPMKDKDINVAFIEIDGRYPDNGYVTNESVKEVVFVAKGKGKIVIENKKYDLKEGDVALIQPKEKYFFDGKLELVVSCNPAWYPEQHKSIANSK
jgi:mannose-6-phosphate isomerase-like protein (cupin superfamily)